jgi:hypothetical protein
MDNDIIDFFWTSNKNVTISTYVDGSIYRDNMLKDKWPVKGAIALMKIHARLRTLNRQEESE